MSSNLSVGDSDLVQDDRLAAMVSLQKARASFARSVAATAFALAACYMTPLSIELKGGFARGLYERACLPAKAHAGNNPKQDTEGGGGWPLKSVLGSAFLILASRTFFKGIRVLDLKEQKKEQTPENDQSPPWG